MAVNRHAQKKSLQSRKRPRATARALRRITTYSRKHKKPDDGDEWGDKMTKDDIDSIAAPNFCNKNYESERRAAIEGMIKNIHMPDMPPKCLKKLKN